MAGTVINSKWDLRLPWQREDLRKTIKKTLHAAAQTTRDIAELAGCSVHQARRVLDALWNDGEADYSGETRDRTWTKK
jgi:predicted ArsR family transcriptional regulator